MTLPRRSARRAGLKSRQQDFLDDLARAVVNTRAGAALVVNDRGGWAWWGCCQRCARTGWLYWCHVFTRGAWAVRWDPDNAFAWCSGCHRYLDQHWEMKREWVLARLGAERFEALQLRKSSGRPDYEATWRTLLGLWRELGTRLEAEQRARFERWPA